ncbi:sugar ABC transporter permease [Halogeometricum sp. S1BR25-6]|uniref:Sugar ABC transporter permease n=1 Tax=Halogeometricum salsisoli TaxID=2950536 RepID=A0ABU2GIZ5_9EURY|nr:sugar ABC transporter permease [Halogeometricum sp. S1BR25-6]MDS0300812.1 sugar ABC transporter permease [Halogeometricum sp. S1BR25-6]
MATTDESDGLTPESRSGRELLEGVLFASPYLIIFGVFLLLPLLIGGYMSLFDWNALAPAESTFVGLENYAQLLADPQFRNALVNTVYFALLTVPSILLVGLGLALGVNRDIKGQGFLRAVFFSPYILTVSVAAILWTDLYSTQYGVINYYLGMVMANPPQWLQSRLFAMPAIALTTVWWLVGFSFVILLSARQSVPEYLYEAARLDGAGTWRQFRDVTVPQMRGAIFFVIVINLIWAFQVYGQPYVMTAGGPGQATETLVMYLYQAAFNQRSFGYASAIGYVLTAILVGVSIANYYLLGGDNE